MTSAIRQIPLDTRIHHHTHDFHQIVIGLRGEAEFEIEGLGGSISANTWRQDLDTLFARISDHYIVDENAFVDELVKVLDANSKDFRRIAGKTAELVREVREMNTAVDTIDAEEVDRLELSLEVFRAVYESETCKGWGHFGLVVQAYAMDELQVGDPRDLGTDVGPVIDEDARQGLTAYIDRLNESFAEEIAKKVRVGNVYVNRNIIGAVVGVQPFGGQGLSGTGPKAGGPHYLLRFATEKTVTVNTSALGGNASLLALGDE